MKLTVSFLGGEIKREDSCRFSVVNSFVTSWHASLNKLNAKGVLIFQIFEIISTTFLVLCQKSKQFSIDQ